MKKNGYEIIALFVQIIIFYIFPLSMHVLDPITTIIFMLLITFSISLILSTISNNKLKYLYSLIISIIFLPTIFIYYNESALIHSLWYLIVSALGIITGTLLKSIILKIPKHSKKNKYIIIIFILILLVTTIYIKNKKNIIGNESNITISNKGISLSVKEKTLTNKGVTLILKNDSNSEIIYTEPYEIEVKKNNVWHKMNVEINFNEPAYILKASQSDEIKINWEVEYGKLQPGDYRIIKKIIISTKNNNYDDLLITAEFKI